MLLSHTGRGVLMNQWIAGMAYFREKIRFIKVLLNYELSYSLYDIFAIIDNSGMLMAYFY